MEAKKVSYALMCLLLLWPAQSLAAKISGHAKVVDGDTLFLDQVKIRLSGVDAPETDQVCLDGASRQWSCGLRARDELSGKIGHSIVECETSDADRYGRLVATCFVGSLDLNEWLVKSGYALAYVEYSQAYVKQEQEAHARHVGMWEGAFVAPWDWRHRSATTAILGSASVPLAEQRRLLSTAAITHDSTCQIKGNVNRKGDRIFHMPGQRDYAKVQMNKGNGERWFCSEDEAAAAGWRKAAR